MTGRRDALIVSPNAAIDSYYVVPALAIGEVNRATSAVHSAGGKGINAGRALRLLGGTPYCLGLAGGTGADFIEEELAREGIDGRIVRVPGETRRTTTVVEPDGTTTVIADPGTAVATQSAITLADAAIGLVSGAHYVLIVGSLTEGLPPDFYGDLIRQVRSASDAVVAIDASGPPLNAALEAAPSIVKVNRAELAATLGSRAAGTLAGMVEAWEDLRARGVRTLIVTDGPAGAFVFSKEAAPFNVLTEVRTVVSAVGAGDTFLAGLVRALREGHALTPAAARASAAAAASLLHIGCGVVDRSEADRLLAHTAVHPLIALGAP